MATSVEDCRKIVERSAQTGLKYMMAETVVYAREFLFIKQLSDRGELGKIQFVQASHQQDMDGWPNYWPGLPPMWYATHCVGPVVALAGTPAEYVSCFGSGTIRPELVKQYGSPFAVETAHVKFKDSDLSARVIRSLFDTARQYRESIDVYGDKASIEWPLIEHEPLIMHTAKLPEHKIPKLVKAPDYAKLLPHPIATKLRDTFPFYKAEGYHQNYVQNHPTQRYVIYNDQPKIAKLKSLFPTLYREKPLRYEPEERRRPKPLIKPDDLLKGEAES